MTTRQPYQQSQSQLQQQQFRQQPLQQQQQQQQQQDQTSTDELNLQSVIATRTSLLHVAIVSSIIFAIAFSLTIVPDLWPLFGDITIYWGLVLKVRFFFLS